MADSEGTVDRDDDVPDPPMGQGDPLAEAGQDGGVPTRQDQQEPDRGVASWKVWAGRAKVVLEVLISLYTVATLVIGLINGNGG